MTSVVSFCMYPHPSSPPSPPPSYPLERLCRCGDVSAVRSLLQEAVTQAGINEVAGINNCAPLHEAAMAGNADIIQYLATEVEGVELDIRTYGPPSFTPLHLAAQQGHVEAVIALVDCGATINVVDRCCRTPKDLACEMGKMDVVHIINMYGEPLVLSNSVCVTQSLYCTK